MRSSRTVLRVALAAALALGVLAAWQSAAEDGRVAAGEKKAEVEKKGGALTGVVTAKEAKNKPGQPAYIEVKADGEAKGRKYSPKYVPADRGFDKKMLATIDTIAVGSRVRLEWFFDERPRVVSIEVLKAASPEKK